jgi:hypothetical protein
MQIDAELALESLWQAFEWEPINLTEMFDQIAHRLRRHPRFAGMTIGEIDLILTDARREAEQDVNEITRAIISAFKDALGFYETDEATA